MPRFVVNADYTKTKSYNVKLTIFARDEEEAEEKATEIIEQWEDITEVNIVETNQE